MTQRELIEALADKEHASWARWMQWVLQGIGVKQEDGSIVLPAASVQVWQRQIETPYADLSDQEKEYDRREVKHILPIIEAYAHPQEETAAPDEIKCPKCGGRTAPLPWAKGYPMQRACENGHRFTFEP